MNDKLRQLLDNFGVALEDPDMGAAFRGFIDLPQLYNSAILEIKTKLEILNDEFNLHHAHNPIHHMESRLKSPRSILSKLIRYDYPLSTLSAREHLYDIAGIRVICRYIDDIYRVEELLLGQSDITLLKRKDYIAQPKPNGYRSLHLSVSVPVFLSERTENVPVEIQIRTIAMDFWASLEHSLRYKSSTVVPDDIRYEIKQCAEQIAMLDLEMQDIYRRIVILENDSEQQSIAHDWFNQ